MKMFVKMYFWWRWEHDACSRSGWSLLLVYQDSDCSVFASLPHSIIAVGWSSRRYQNRSDWRTEMVTKPQIMPSVVWSIYLNHHLLKHNLYRGRPTTILTFFAHLSYSWSHDDPRLWFILTNDVAPAPWSWLHHLSRRNWVFSRLFMRRGADRTAQLSGS